MPAEYHQDAYELVCSLPDKSFDTIILDPPYSLRKSREKYGGRYIGKFTKIKDVLPRILKDNGKIITFGYNSVGMSKSRGFTKIGILLVCHNGDHDDTVAVIENKDLIGLVETPLNFVTEEAFERQVGYRLKDLTHITMCVSTKCEKRNTCYRSTAEPSFQQAYADFTPLYEGDECDNFIRED